MKVEASRPHEPRPATLPETPAAARSRSRETAAGAVGAPGGVELSGTAQAFLRLRPLLDGVDASERDDRIARLRDEIASGRYAVDGERIAAAMLHDDAVVGMLGVRRR